MNLTTKLPSNTRWRSSNFSLRSGNQCGLGLGGVYLTLPHHLVCLFFFFLFPFNFNFCVLILLSIFRISLRFFLSFIYLFFVFYIFHKFLFIIYNTMLFFFYFNARVKCRSMVIWLHNPRPTVNIFCE